MAGTRQATEFSSIRAQGPPKPCMASLFLDYFAHQARHVGGSEKDGRNVRFRDEPIMAAPSECLIFFDVGWDDRLTVAQLMLSRG